jgi:hypothetical protein
MIDACGNIVGRAKISKYSNEKLKKLHFLDIFGSFVKPKIIWNESSFHFPSFHEKLCSDTTLYNLQVFSAGQFYSSLVPLLHSERDLISIVI